MYSFSPTLDPDPLQSQEWFNNTYYSYSSVEQQTGEPISLQELCVPFETPHLITDSSFCTDALNETLNESQYNLPTFPSGVEPPAPQMSQPKQHRRFHSTPMVRSYPRPPQNYQADDFDDTHFEWPKLPTNQPRKRPTCTERDFESCYADNIFSDNSSRSSVSPASFCFPLEAHNLPAPSAPPTSRFVYLSSDDEEGEVEYKCNDARVALARVLARSRSRSHSLSSRRRLERSKSLIEPRSSERYRAQRAARAATIDPCQPRSYSPYSVNPQTTNQHDRRNSYDLGLAASRNNISRPASPKKRRTSLAVAFNYQQSLSLPHNHDRHLSITDLSQLSLEPNHGPTTNLCID